LSAPLPFTPPHCSTAAVLAAPVVREHRLARALRFARAFRGAIVLIGLITLALAVLNAFEPLVLKFLFDHLTQPAPARAITTGVVGLLVIGGLREIANAYCDRLTWQTRLGIQHELLARTVERLYHLPIGARSEEGVGAVLTRLDRSIQGFVEAVTRLLFQVLPALAYLAISIVLMLQLDRTLALLVLGFAPLPALIAARAAPRQMQRERALLDRWSHIYARFNEVLSGLVVVRSFAMEEPEKRRFLRDVSDANEVVLRGVASDAGFTAMANLTVTLARIAAIAVGCTLVMNGRITIGTLVAFIGYVGGLFGPVQGLSGIYQTVRRASVSLEEIFAILDARDALADAPGAREPATVTGSVRYENVHFRYPAGRLSVLQGVDLEVPAGSTLAVVGPSGSGKSTLAALLLRLHDPQTGTVQIDGHDVRTLRQSWLRGHVAVVLQDPLLFNDSVRNNIAYGRPHATQAEIEAAARAANAHEFIRRLPDGYHSRVGERGNRLSAGERQRLTIARALVKDAPIVILDEATSSLDAESEGLVNEALDRLMAGRTVLVIAHRLATVVAADQIVVLRGGRVSESGTHAELMNARGYYASLIAQQTRGLLVTDPD
jgi:ATP-binding cassette subfamily B protein